MLVSRNAFCFGARGGGGGEVGVGGEKVATPHCARHLPTFQRGGDDDGGGASARGKCWRKKKVVVFASEGAIKSYPTDMKVCDSSRATCDKHVVINKH